MRICKIEGCNNKQVYCSMGLCKKHYMKQYYQDTKIERNKKEKSKYCKICNKPIYFKSIYCNKCKQLKERNPFYGRHHTKEAKETIRGKNSPHWKGGITSLYEVIRHCFKYKQWRLGVFTRDKFACQICGDSVGRNLNAHHIVPFTDILERHEILTLEEAINCGELWDINNGVTLCKDCHKELHSELNLTTLKCRKIYQENTLYAPAETIYD